LAKLIAGGDSFVYGSELKDCVNIHSQFTYPALISKRTGMEYVCAAKPGLSNGAIRRLVMDTCESHKNDIGLVLVSWTFLGRYEFKFDETWEQITAWSVIDNLDDIKKEFHIDNPVIFEWHVKELKNQKQRGISQFAKIFYHYVGGFEYWELYTSLVDLIMLQQYLQLHNIPYLFTSADHGLTNVDHFKNDVSLTSLLNQFDRKNWFWFPTNLGFYEWSKENQFPFGTTHPLEESHSEAEKLIYEYLRNIGRLP
jgi:hypothetical protein